MDKCILSNNDIDELFKWRDSHINLIYRDSVPIKAIEIILPDINSRTKYIRKDNTINIHFVFNENERYNYKLRKLAFGSHKFEMIKQPSKEVDSIGANSEMIEGIVGMYFALMALMTYGDDVEYTEQELDILDDKIIRKTESKTNKRKNKKDSIIYLFNRDSNGRLGLYRKGKHNSPKGQFNVRGHFRHLKDGRIIWIAEYKKGVGKKKNKTYKL